MRRLAVALVVPAALAAPSAGTWRTLPAAPIGVTEGLVSVWTGKQMLVFGHLTSRAEDGQILKSVTVAAAYDPSANRWRRLTPLTGKGTFTYDYSAVWTGKEMVVWSPVDQAYNPSTDRWRRLPRAPSGGRKLVVWTGREMIGWGGGCCGDAVDNGVAYNPATNGWRKLARSPLAGSQHPLGAWTGRELDIFVGNLSPDGKPWPARLARAAAYDPTTTRWRRIAPIPEFATASNAVWDGREILVVGGIGRHRGFAYNPATNRWRDLPGVEPSRVGAVAIWTGKRLLLWGGEPSIGSMPAHGLSYDPTANRWSPLPPAPIPGRTGPTGVWTGRELIVWGGGDGNPPFTDGAAFRP